MPRVNEAEIDRWRGIWVIGETEGRELAAVTRQLLGAGAYLAERSGADLTLVLLGSGVRAAAAEAARYGATKAFLADHESLAQYSTERYATILSRLVEQHRPAIVLCGATCVGRDLVPRVAARLKTGLTADTLELQVDDKGRFVQVCPGYGGRVLADIHCPEHRPQMATVRPNALPTPAAGPGSELEVVDVSAVAAEAVDPVSIIAREADPHAGQVNLPQAQIIVGGGRGLKTQENFERLYELAELLGGAVGATRAVVDEGWAPPYCQVGQTGLTVQPKLYLAFGISGAVQHTAGVSNAKVIIAVNTDPDAPIFRIADYGFVADAVQVLEKLIEALRSRRQGGCV